MPRFEDYAALSNLVYQLSSPQQILVPTAVQGGNEIWTLLDSRSDDATGYFGAAYFNSRTKEVILVNRGTEPTDVRDLASDAQMLLDRVPAQFDPADKFYSDIRDRILDLDPNNPLFGATLSITGHSLGGSLTQLLVAKHAGDTFNGVGVSAQTFNALGVRHLLNNPEIGRPQADYAITNWVVPSDVVGNLANHVGSVASLSSLPFSYLYPAGAPGVLLFALDSHSIANIEKNFIADNRHPLLGETKDVLVQEFVTDPGFGITIDGSAYVGGNNRLNIGNQLTGGSTNDLMFGGRPDDRLHGGDGQDVIYAGPGNDVLWGDAGADFLLGEDGDDTYIVDDANDRVIEAALGGNDTVASTVSYTLSRHVEQLILQGTEAINGTGNELDNVLIGNNAANVLDGGFGTDSLAGGAGDDTYLVRDLNDRIVEAPGEGTDTVRSFVSYTLSGNLEKLILEGDFAVVGFGNDLDNELIGSTASNVLLGRGGDDLLQGAGGDDLYLWNTGDGRDRIEDTLGSNTVVVNSQLLQGGLKRQSESVYTSLDGQVTYQRAGTDLVVNGTLTIKDWQEGQFGIRLKDLPDEPQDDGVTGAGGRSVFRKIDHYVQVGTLPDGTPILEPVYVDLFDEEANSSTQADPPITDEGNAINALGGNDFVQTFAGVDTIHGGEGNDQIYAGGGNDYLHGEGGQDTLFGEAGADKLYGGADDDTLEGGLDEDWLYGGAGVDQLTGGDGNDQLLGEDGDDTLVGNDGDDRLLGGEGDDNLNGGKGADYLDAEGGTGEHTIIGGTGSDIVKGGDGRDFLFGDTGDHTSLSEGGNDWIDGGDGDDGGDPQHGLQGGAGSDTLFGGAGNDWLFGDGPNNAGIAWDASFDGQDYLDGGTGDDELQGGGNDDTLVGGLGNDRLFGDSSEPAGVTGDDLLYGDDGSDVLQGMDGDDVLFGGTGDDTLFGDSGFRPDDTGHDVLDGGDGNDFLAGGTGNDILAGGSGHDRLYGTTVDDAQTADADQLAGEGGDDELYGGGGLDILSGGEGHDVLASDDLIGFAPDGSRFAVLTNAPANETLDGGTGNDKLYGGGGHDTLTGGDGDDLLLGDDLIALLTTPGANTDPFFSPAFDPFNSTNLAVSISPGHDLLDGGNGNDFLFGRAGDDILFGGAGSDRLDGGDGDDQLDGGADDDVLNSGEGNNALLGGEGNDNLTGGSFDGTPFGPGPDPEIDDGGDPPPVLDPVINGHAFLIPGGLQILAGNGDNSLQGGLEKNVIIAGGGNNQIDAPGTENTVVVGGGTNLIGVGGVSSTVAVGEGQNLVTDLSQNGVMTGGAGHLVARFGIGNHTIIGGTEDDRLEREQDMLPILVGAC